MHFKPFALAALKVAPAYGGVAVTASHINAVVSVIAGVLTALYTGVLLAKALWSWRNEVKARQAKPMSPRTKSDE